MGAAEGRRVAGRSLVEIGGRSPPPNGGDVTQPASGGFRAQIPSPAARVDGSQWQSGIVRLAQPPPRGAHYRLTRPHGLEIVEPKQPWPRPKLRGRGRSLLLYNGWKGRG